MKMAKQISTITIMHDWKLCVQWNLVQCSDSVVGPFTGV